MATAGKVLHTVARNVYFALMNCARLMRPPMAVQDQNVLFSFHAENACRTTTWSIGPFHSVLLPSLIRLLLSALRAFFFLNKIT